MSRAFSQYLAERFPVGAYLVLIGAMVAAASASASAATGAVVVLNWAQGLGTITLLLGFFVLRVFDEHKDYDRDLVAHPDRVLSRGLITLADLRRAGIAAVAVQLVLTVPFGVPGLLWLLAYLAFAVAMRFEFGVGRWLNQHLVLYAITHNPIVALMMAYAVVISGGIVVLEGPVLWWLLTASCTSLGFEVGRKLRAPADEREAQDTYTQALGIPRAVAFLIGVEVLSVAAAWPLLATPWGQVVLALAALVMLGGPMRFYLSPTPGAAKLAENTSTLGALVIYIVVVADTAARLGVVWS
ncbi:MAG: hypothetical protein ACI9WU_000475 [Myxococcota bacterium]|jgi:hypothetical protein